MPDKWFGIRFFPPFVSQSRPSNLHISYVQYWKNAKVNNFIGYGYCGAGFQKARRYLTKEERIALLKEYKDELEKEGQGVVERIKELEASRFDPAFFF